MASEDEELVILEADDEQNQEEIVELELEGESDDILDEELSKLQEEEQSPKDPKKRKQLIYIIILSLIALSIIIVALVLLSNVLNEDTTKQIDTKEIVENIQKKEPAPQFSPSKVENMLQRANALYEKGNKIEALNIYKNIATFNESLSNYNMGVAQMKDNNLKDAIESFRRAILNQENRTVSAINAAVCALRLKNNKLYNYYLDLAYLYLPEESNSPLYSYYIALINYYKNNYYEALLALNHPSTVHYKNKHEYLASKIFSFIGNSYSALSSLETIKNPKNVFSEGLLYANIGEYTIAKEKLEKAIENGIEIKRAKLALALINMKIGNLLDASTQLRTSFEQEPQLTLESYPIKATLNKALFDVNKAQRDFANNLFFDKKRQYELIFYFAPYKVFNAKQTMQIIRKGGINVFLDETNTALDYLNTSANMSKVNISMSEGIKEALNHRILKANMKFKDLLNIYPKHAILHYNLALTYAQLGNYSLAQKHFFTSYHLDPKNYLAGLFGAISSEIIGKSNEKLLEDVKKTITEDTAVPDINFYMAVAHLIENNQFSTNRWLEEDKDKTSPLHLIFDVITAKLVDNKREYLKNAKLLQNLLPQDIVANIVSFHAQYANEDIKEYAKKMQMDFFKRDLDMDSFFYGSQIAKEQYVKFLQISGLIYKKRDSLKKRLAVEQKDVVGLMHALAYLYIYTNDFEQAYVLYNNLIDQHHQQDTNTIFLAATASIGAGHPENAIALLELSKLIDPNNLESRFALGLLYQEIKNYLGATTQYAEIGNTGFKSEYFDFKIVHN